MDALLLSLQGGDRRSIGAVPLVVRKVLAQPRLFAVVFDGMCEPDPLVAMRCADAVEKITAHHLEWLRPCVAARAQGPPLTLLKSATLRLGTVRAMLERAGVDMLQRRRWILGAATVGIAPLAAGCSSQAYEQAAQSLWRVGGLGNADRPALLHELVRCATLAPSSHNTQCWRFAIEPQRISILPDLTRRCPAVDPDDHHLYVSLGCAAENLVHAASAHGLMALPAFDAARDAVGIGLEPTQATSTALFKAIAERQCTRGEYDGQALSSADLALLQKAGSSDQVDLILLTEKPALERVLEQVVQGNTAQMADPAFVAELKAWIRFSGADAVRLGDGLFAASSGNPVLPAWLGSTLFDWFFTPKSENDKYAKHVRSSAGIAVFAAKSPDKAGWVEAGRCYERFALQATALGVRNAMLNQPIEVAALRAPFAASVGLGSRRPDLVVRFGRGPKLPPSLRRPVAAVLV